MDKSYKHIISLAFLLIILDALYSVYLQPIDILKYLMRSMIQPHHKVMCVEVVFLDIIAENSSSWADGVNQKK